MEPERRATFEYQHHRLDQQLRKHLLDVVSADFAAALPRLRRWRRALARHIEIEETRLLPHVSADARWPAKLYRMEHERILLLADQYAARVQAVAARPPRARRARNDAVLTLLDAAHGLRHLIEHHHEREHIALAHELPAALQEAAWGRAPAAGKRQAAEALRRESHANGS